MLIINPYAAELFVSIFHNLKLELLTQFPASNDEKYLYLWKIQKSKIDKFKINYLIRKTSIPN